ncbi:hypothetical protein MAR_030362 [Mya arenaria]|uniref:Uncharacterized protein n=1 Tax=Mya arenaria TaxID=6604 RepID=A0ABY7DJ46_MYAAR|nr:hypothetical protein MAR_030362 [Mya arenaria]
MEYDIVDDLDNFPDLTFDVDQLLPDDNILVTSNQTLSLLFIRNRPKYENNDTAIEDTTIDDTAIEDTAIVSPCNENKRGWKTDHQQQQQEHNYTSNNSSYQRGKGCK